jgi:hypothetical protein
MNAIIIEYSLIVFSIKKEFLKLNPKDNPIEIEIIMISEINSFIGKN